ncbi:MAG: hypothetical protein A3G33_04940 [Omnitrophica bacterium RIFCSPLOWO2_12_FULL_44_17]|uniref:Response regulatory domain-containing protein n=1 Tax=Candidatus Danuiimicrobium aquiferis TaxID=1801832 RepID=A0A1G1KYC6_9BACT|nr:MAG: hypothetical protein A3B72_02365 [Omnitrophica bacterium RIFCSPHIGHO2_02_FULL_45_28]OGW89186.1 MAG: hypothetical protein A3E74_07880 [Omnitrophica bacterium RIFCSPHIGHO2_12_FULL_44_12]OGW97639.1 MAG: hypothetical protein A3G33_04940 [Omnitrophica bacterium RIFCSPLOWO2_12_FULL_44_17]
MTEQKTLLIIDDEESLVKMLKRYLVKQGYNVLTAPDGEIGLSIANKTNPDLIILDITMPKKDGFEFYRDISTEHGHTRFPVLVLTARADLKGTFERIEADGFMSKPFEMEDLLKEIERILAKPQKINVFLVDLAENPQMAEIANALAREKYQPILIPEIGNFEKIASVTRPDFIVMEYLHEQISGEDFIRKAKEYCSKLPPASPGKTSNTPIIVYTFSGMNFKEKSLRAGADLYIGQPENSDAIVIAVRKLEIEKNERK